MVCVIVWALPLVIIIADFYWGCPVVTEMTFTVYVLLPYPLLIISLGGTIKALSVTSSVPPEEKRRIVALLVLVLLIYTVLFLPTAIWCLGGTVRNSLGYLSFVTIKFSPLADLFMYVFLRKGAVDSLLTSVLLQNGQHWWQQINRLTFLISLSLYPLESWFYLLAVLFWLYVGKHVPLVMWRPVTVK